MKRLRVYGCKNNPELKEEIITASTFFINSLLPRKRKYDITVTAVNDLIDKEETFGECWSWSPNVYCIRFDKNQTQENRIKTLAHEFVHLKQFAFGELKFLTQFNIWQDKIFYHEAKYNLVPWEREASKMENVLYDRYIKFLYNSNIINNK